MGVYIKGMEMPKTCYDCYFCRTYDEPNQGYFCIPLFADLHRTDFTKKRIDACPLIEVPTPHGRLIDAEWLKLLYDDPAYGIDTSKYHVAVPVILANIDDAPTVIEREET